MKSLNFSFLIKLVLIAVLSFNSLGNNFFDDLTHDQKCNILIRKYLKENSTLRRKDISVAMKLPKKSVVTEWVDKDLIQGDSGHERISAIKVNRVGKRKTNSWEYIGYNRTNRSIKHLTDLFYPEKLLSYDELRGKKVIDIGSGGGKAVIELRQMGIEAYALDIALSSLQFFDVYIGRKKPHSDGVFLSEELGEGYFVQADASNTGLASGQFDVIFSTYSIFGYDLTIGDEKSKETLTKALLEFKRILKVGGVIRLSPIFRKYTDDKIRDLVDKVDGLEINTLEQYGPDRDIMYAEIIKTN